MPPTVERKLTTVLCADVEGYSRLMDRDEVGTLEILKRHRDALAGLIERHFCELAVATAIALFGFQSGTALATVVGVLIEVPVMLSVVRIVRRSRGWYEQG